MCSWHVLKILGAPMAIQTGVADFDPNTLSDGTTFSRASWDGKPQGAVKAKKQLDVEVGTISGLDPTTLDGHELQKTLSRQHGSE